MFAHDKTNNTTSEEIILRCQLHIFKKNAKMQNRNKLPNRKWTSQTTNPITAKKHESKTETDKCKPLTSKIPNQTQTKLKQLPRNIACNECQEWNATSKGRKTQTYAGPNTTTSTTNILPWRCRICISNAQKYAQIATTKQISKPDTASTIVKYQNHHGTL